MTTNPTAPLALIRELRDAYAELSAATDAWDAGGPGDGEVDCREYNSAEAIRHREAVERMDRVIAKADAYLREQERGEERQSSHHVHRGADAPVVSKSQAKRIAIQSASGAVSDEDVLSADDMAAMREQYTPSVIPPCRVCGGPLSIASIGAGNATVYACSIQEDDPDRPGCWRIKAGRGENEFGAGGHYSDSQWTDYHGSGDRRVLALLESFASRHALPAQAVSVPDEVSAGDRLYDAFSVDWPGIANDITDEQYRKYARAVLAAAPSPPQHDKGSA